MDRRTFLSTAGAGTSALLAAYPVSAASAPAVSNSSRYLVLDSRIIQKTENAQLAVGEVRKDKNNPLFKEDKPWEPRFDNVYCNVIYDEEDKIYKCWYSPFIIDERTTSTKPAERHPGPAPYMDIKPNRREMGVCYATSKDGIHWEKPELGLVEFEGSKANNILFRGEGMKGVFLGPHGAGVFKDLREKDPAKRYKMFFRAEKMGVAFSADGLRWGNLILSPDIDAVGDTHNNAIWAPTLGRYVGITRLWNRQTKVRLVGRTESPDFQKWTKSETVFTGVSDDKQIHDLVVFPVGDVYIGMVGLMNFRKWPSNDLVTEHAELAWSPDTKEWHRIQEGTPFIGHSPANNPAYSDAPYDWGIVFTSCPIFRGDQIEIYYGACNWHFFDWRKGYLARATLRKDGWAGFKPLDEKKRALITTVPVMCAGGTLGLCADVANKGSVKVTAFDGNNKKLADGQLITRTVTDGAVRWKGNFSLSGLQGKPVRLSFELLHAKLYSFCFSA